MVCHGFSGDTLPVGRPHKRPEPRRGRVLSGDNSTDGRGVCKEDDIMTLERITSLCANLGLTRHAIYNIVPRHIASDFQNIRLV